MDYPTKCDNVSPLSKPKPDIVYAISQDGDDPNSRDEYEPMMHSKSKLILPFGKIFGVASYEETMDLQCGNARILLPQLIIERKSSSGDLHNCQNQLFGGLFVVSHAMRLASQLLALPNDPVVFGIANVGHLMEVWAMQLCHDTVQIISFISPADS